MSATTQVDILRRVFEPENANLSAAAARSILAVDFTEADKDRMNVLAAKAREGRLSKEEDFELEEYIQVGHLLTILQSKARRSLKKPAARN